MGTILVTGANGQIGTELCESLASRYGAKQVIGVDLHPPNEIVAGTGIQFEQLDVTDASGMRELARTADVEVLYHLVGILSAKGERMPDLAWEVNVTSLRHVLDIAASRRIRVFWPSSIAVFGVTAPRKNTPQRTVLEPSSIYGVCKVAGELLCRYAWLKNGVDVRSVRFPGIISHKAAPGGGTTDYAVEIFHQALASRSYVSFLSEPTILPMMYMEDAVRATLELMDADPEKLTVRTSYNLAAISFSVAEIAAEIRKHIPDFSLESEPDARQAIADSWPDSIDDTPARDDWGWQHRFDLAGLTSDMISHLRERLEVLEEDGAA